MTTWHDHMKYGKLQNVFRDVGSLVELLTWDLGPVVRHGPNRLVFNTATALRGMLPSHDHSMTSTNLLRHIS